MSRLTLEVLEQTLFSQGLGKEPSAFQRAVTRYFDTFGRLDPLDLLGAPAFVPRIGRLRGRGALEFFDEAVEAIIERRRAVIRDGGEAPRDLLTLLVGGPGSGDRRRAAGGQHARQYRHLHQRGPRDDGQRADLDALPPLAVPGMARARRGGSGFRFRSRTSRVARRVRVLRAVLEEALRLYPPAAMLTREAIGDDTILGHTRARGHGRH